MPSVSAFSFDLHERDRISPSSNFMFVGFNAVCAAVRYTSMYVYLYMIYIGIVCASIAGIIDSSKMSVQNFRYSR